MQSVFPLLLLGCLTGLEAASGFWEGNSPTESPFTVTYNPGEDCMPWDGSVVPDCRKYVDENTKWSIYYPHSENCSRFWECGPPEWTGSQFLYETCLFECAACQAELGSNPQCTGDQGPQYALTFDPSYQYPDGPVCDWPSSIVCACDITEPDVECCLDSDCPSQPGGCPDSYCLGFKCHHDRCGCDSNDDCSGWQSDCDISSTPYGDCNYCGLGQDCQGGDDNGCCPGCLTDSQCGDGWVCTADHLCEQDICAADGDCTGFDSICDISTFPHGDCTYCGPEDNCPGTDGCCPGCGGLPNNGNCEHPRPVCLGNHECGCKMDSDCEAGFYCDDSEEHPLCKQQCQGNGDCDGFDAICDVATFPHGDCFYCGTDCGDSQLVDGCCPGCGGLDNNGNCEHPRPVCLGNHECGCQMDSDCNSGWYCDTSEDHPLCKEQCKDHPDCSGFDEICNAAHDNCFFCGECVDQLADGCCPGCHEDSNCAGTMICNTDTHICEEPICQADLECENFDQRCDFPDNFPHTTCFFCAGDADLCGTKDGCCPGCGGNGGKNCGDFFPVCLEDRTCGCSVDADCADLGGSFFCNTEIEHPKCQISQGAVTLKTVKVTTRDCVGCMESDEKMVSMELTGLSETSRCSTPKLDHPDHVDYIKDKQTSFSDHDGLGFVEQGTCFGGDLKARVTSAKLTWGSANGQWTPEKVCFEWSDPVYPAYTCTLGADGSSTACSEQPCDA